MTFGKQFVKHYWLDMARLVCAYKEAEDCLLNKDDDEALTYLALQFMNGKVHPWKHMPRRKVVAFLDKNFSSLEAMQAFAFKHGVCGTFEKEK